MKLNQDYLYHLIYVKLDFDNLMTELIDIIPIEI
jgi:hypothetical protein